MKRCYNQETYSIIYHKFIVFQMSNWRIPYGIKMYSVHGGIYFSIAPCMCLGGKGSCCDMRMMLSTLAESRVCRCGEWWDGERFGLQHSE